MFGLPGLVQGYTVASSLILRSEQVLGAIPAVIKSVFRRDPGMLKFGAERLAKLPRPILSLFTGSKGQGAVIPRGHTPRAIHNERRRRFGKCNELPQTSGNKCLTGAQPAPLPHLADGWLGTL